MTQKLRPLPNGNGSKASKPPSQPKQPPKTPEPPKTTEPPSKPPAAPSVGDLPVAGLDPKSKVVVVHKNGASKLPASAPLPTPAPEPMGDLPPPKSSKPPKPKKAPKPPREKKAPKPPRVIPDSTNLADLVSLKGVKIPRDMLAAATAAGVKQGRTLQDVVVAALCNFGQMGQTASDPCPHCGDRLPAHPLPRRSHLKACEKKHANGGAK